MNVSRLFVIDGDILLNIEKITLLHFEFHLKLRVVKFLQF